MLSNILIMIMSFALPIFCFFSFRWGVRFGNDKDRAANYKNTGWSMKKPKQSEDIDRVNRILDNIDNYQGDGAGQREIRA